MLRGSVAAVCPNVKTPVFGHFEWESDLDKRQGRVKVGAVFETEGESLTGFGDPPPPYQIKVTTPRRLRIHQSR